MLIIAIIDYGAGNLCSVELAFRRIGVKTCITKDASVIDSASGVVLPGVGAFADAMQALEKSGLIPSVYKAAASKRPLLGICLGMQMLLDKSEEGPKTQGLGLISGHVKRLSMQGLKIPHIGWNSLKFCKSSRLFNGLTDSAYVYFVHSYACKADKSENVLASTQYGESFDSAIQKSNVMGLQFHPEKSGITGQIMLKNFADMSVK